MASSDDPTAAVDSALNVDEEVEEEVLPGEPAAEQPEASADGTGEDASDQTLERAAELFEKGSKAMEEGDFVEAVDSLSRALEIRVAHFGELAADCAVYYYEYGCALLYKAQVETDPLGDVPKGSPKHSEKSDSITSAEDSRSSKASDSHMIQNFASSNNLETLEGSASKDQDDNKQSDNDDDDELAEADEDESDLDLAWKMLDVARAIVEKQPEDMIEKVNILAALGEVSMEREDIETSLNDYLKALSILERLVEPDNRRVIELNFRVCLVLEVGSRVEEAIPYCQKAISLCKSQLDRLKREASSSEGTQSDVSKHVPDSEKNDNQRGGLTSAVKEIDVLSGILDELEKKLEDLQQAMASPKSIFSEVLKMVASKAASDTKNLPKKEAPRPLSLSSSQIAGINEDTNSLATSTAATNGGNITHLGVVGRGVKRAVVNQIVPEPLSKKPMPDTSAEKTDSCNTSEVLDSSVAHNLDT